MQKRWRDLPAFSPPEARSISDPLAITELHAWRLREPVSNRRYTVVRLTTRGGITGYGEGASANAGEIATAKSTVVGRLAFETEFVRHHLSAVPAMEAAVSNAMLDVVSKPAEVPIYQYLGGPTHACEGPIGGIASLHVDAAMPNFLVQEICGAVQSGERDQVWEDLLGFSAMRMVNGRYPLPDKPGLGFELNEAALKRYPFKGTVPFPPAFEADGSLASQ